MRRLPYIIAALVLAGLLVWAFMPKPVPVEMAEVAPRTIVVTVEEEGEARIRELFTVSATIAGKLRRIDLHAGDEVFADKTVVASIGPAAPALLDSRSRAVAEAAMAAARSAVDLARAQLAQAEATLDFAMSEAERSQVLFDRAAIARRLLDNAMLGRKTAEAAVDSARANLSVRERELDSATAVLSGSDGAGPDQCCVTLFAPVSGRVLRVLTESEQVVQPGTPILEIGNPANLEIVVDLLSRDAVRVREGAQATITGWGGDPLPARVARVEPSATTKISALGIEEQRVQVILDIAGDPAARRTLGHGFRTIVQITLWRGEGTLSIPVAALFRDGSDWATYTIRGNRARLQRIALGERNDAYAQVLDGLAMGDQVILRPSDRISDGTLVAAMRAE